MKPCGACGQSLPRESFSKKQWQSKQHRRCKICITNDRQAMSEAEPDLPSSSLAETAAGAQTEPQSGNPLMPGRDDDRGVEAWTDEELFREPPPREDCPICFIRLPLDENDIIYQSCCGKNICVGCVYAFGQQSPGKLSSCPFCRTPEPLTEREVSKRMAKRAKDNDPDAMRNLAGMYHYGWGGLPRDYGKAMELSHRAGELGSAASYCVIGRAYQEGEAVEADMDKAKYYYALAAMGGYVEGRFNLGTMELKKGNADRAVKHFMISAGRGHDSSVAAIRKLFAQGRARKGDFEMALRAYGEARAETKSVQRDAAAADP